MRLRRLNGIYVQILQWPHTIQALTLALAMALMATGCVAPATTVSARGKLTAIRKQGESLEKKAYIKITGKSPQEHTKERAKEIADYVEAYKAVLVDVKKVLPDKGSKNQINNIKSALDLVMRLMKSLKDASVTDIRVFTPAEFHTNTQDSIKKFNENTASSVNILTETLS